MAGLEIPTDTSEGVGDKVNLPEDGILLYQNVYETCRRFCMPEHPNNTLSTPEAAEGLAGNKVLITSSFRF
jgi:hypothetical protein